jgi:hypothetical protein
MEEREERERGRRGGGRVRLKREWKGRDEVDGEKKEGGRQSGKRGRVCVCVYGRLSEREEERKRRVTNRETKRRR